MSPFRPSFLRQPAVYSQPFNFDGPLFSYSYELLFPQPLYFDNDLNCPGVWGAHASNFQLCLSVSLWQVPSLSPVESYSCGLFVAPKRVNSFAIKQIQTLCAKYRGVASAAPIGGHPGWGTHFQFSTLCSLCLCGKNRGIYCDSQREETAAGGFIGVRVAENLITLCVSCHRERHGGC